MAHIIHHSPDSKTHKIDKFMYVVAFIGPVMTIAQINQIWVNKNTSGVSLTTWATLTVLSIVWIIYALSHKLRLLVFYYFLCFVVDITIVLGLLIIH